MNLIDAHKLAQAAFGEAADRSMAKHDDNSLQSMALSERDQIASLASNVDLPAWMLEKLVRISEKTDIFELEKDEIIILSHALRTWPELAGSLPTSFLERIKSEDPQELTAIERAAILIAAHDWQLVSDCYVAATTEDKFCAKLLAIVFALREGGYNEQQH
jgi:hypothetical protein